MIKICRIINKTFVVNLTYDILAEFELNVYNNNNEFNQSINRRGSNNNTIIYLKI